MFGGGEESEGGEDETPPEFVPLVSAALEQNLGGSESDGRAGPIQ